MNKHVMVKTFEEIEDSFKNNYEQISKALYDECERVTEKLIHERVEFSELEKELKMYRNALTQAVARPMGVLPDCEQWYCVNLNGNIVVRSR